MGSVCWAYLPHPTVAEARPYSIQLRNPALWISGDLHLSRIFSYSDDLISNEAESWPDMNWSRPCIHTWCDDAIESDFCHNVAYIFNWQNKSVGGLMLEFALVFIISLDVKWPELQFELGILQIDADSNLLIFRLSSTERIPLAPIAWQHIYLLFLWIPTERLADNTYRSIVATIS